MTTARRWQVRKLLIYCLFLLSAVAFLDRTNISIAGPAIQRQLGLDNVHLGWVFSAFLLGYAAFQAPGGWLAGRMGPRRVLAAGVVWWGLFTALTTVSTHGILALPLLIAIRFLLGAGEAVIYPASNLFVARWIPVSERGWANGWIFAGVGAGAGLSIPVLTWIIGRWEWRASFWFCALLGIAAGLLWYRAASDAPEEHARISAEELKLIQETRSMQPEEKRAEPAPWLRALLNRNVAALTLSYFSFGYVAWIFFSWFFIYLAQARGLNLKANAFFSMLPFLAMTIGCLSGGFLSDWVAHRVNRRAGRCGVAAAAMAVTAIFLVAGSHARGSYAASVILAGGAGALYLSQSAFWAVSADLAGERSGVVSGVMNMSCQIGGAVTATLTPWLAGRFGWNAAFVAGAVLAAAGGALWLLVDPGQEPREGLQYRQKPEYARAEARE